MDNSLYEAALNSAALFDVSDRAKITLSGPEASAYLHNLCTQDVKNLHVGEGAEAFLCTAKAKIVGHVFITRLQDQLFILDADASQGERLLKHLNHYLISEQVEISDATRSRSMLRLCGPKAEAIVSSVLDSSSWMRRHDLLVLPTFDVFCPPEQAPRLTQRIVEAGATSAGPETYEVLRVEAGLPLYGVDMDENRFVVETGRIVQAISYTKGCYLGQEPIVMARDRGQVNRTLLGVKFDEGELPAAGTKLYRGTEEAGQVTSSVRSPRFGCIGLAYIRRGSQEAGTTLTMGAGPGSRGAAVASLPFAGSPPSPVA